MPHRTALGRPLLTPLLPLALISVLWRVAPPSEVARAWSNGLHADDGGALLVTAGIALGAWAVLGWLATGVLATAAAALPGRIGRLGRTIADRITPALLRRLLSGGTVAGIALTPVVLPAAAQASTSVPAVGCAGVAPSLDRAPVGCPTAITTTVPSPTVPNTPTPTTAGLTAAGPSAPAPTTPAPAISSSPPREATVGPTTVVVRGGDSLWSLAQAELRAAGRPATASAVAARWPAWWAANRAELGDEPGLIHPGEVLRAPTT